MYIICNKLDAVVFLQNVAKCFKANILKEEEDIYFAF